MAKLDDLEWFEVETREQWRAWLGENHASSPGIWLVTWKKASGRPVLTYDQRVEEALAWGWIDSKAMTVDADRARLVFLPRRPGSGWSRPNKERIVRLEDQGLMQPAGRRVDRRRQGRRIVDAARRRRGPDRPARPGRRLRPPPR